MAALSHCLVVFNESSVPPEDGTEPSVRELDSHLKDVSNYVQVVGGNITISHRK